MLSNTTVDERLAGGTIKRIGDYTNGQVPLLWECLECGNQWEARPAKIVNGCTGCPICNTKKRNEARRLGVDAFVERAHMVHDNKFDYSLVSYTNASTPVDIICPTHGVFSQVPDSHLRGDGCGKCYADRRRYTKDEFVEKARSIHGDKYSYDKFVYSGAHIKGVITCNIHGDFLQKPNTHISRPAGCPVCDIESRKGSYSVEYFDKNPNEKNKPGYLYVVRLYENNHSFIKIGMAVDVNKRLKYYRGMNRELLITIPGTLFNTYTLEQRLLTLLKPHKYYPTKTFEGYTECVKDNQEVLTILEELLVTP